MISEPKLQVSLKSVSSRAKRNCLILEPHRWTGDPLLFLLQPAYSTQVKGFRVVEYWAKSDLFQPEIETNMKSSATVALVLELAMNESRVGALLIGLLECFI
jgi:hypothetical protein